MITLSAHRDELHRAARLSGPQERAQIAAELDAAIAALKEQEDGAKAPSPATEENDS
jgi:hypothetical protein